MRDGFILAKGEIPPAEECYVHPAFVHPGPPEPPDDLARAGPASRELVAQDRPPRADWDPTGRAGRREPAAPGKVNWRLVC